MSDKETIFLVADDDPIARGTVSDFLKSAGYTKVFEVSNGQEALAFMQSCEVGFVICDWEMPVLDGLGVLKAMKAEEKFKDVPFVIITSPISNERIKVADAGAQGVDAYLIKPFRRRVFLQKIADILFERDWNRKKGVIVADDDDQVRKFLVDAMGQLGYGPVFAAADGEEAFKLVEAHFNEISIVISDWEMPKLRGIELLRKVRTDRRLSRLPFIIVTSRTSRENSKLKLAIESEVDHYLMKPFRLNDLREKMDVVFARAKAEEDRIRLVAAGYAAVAEFDENDATRCFLTVLDQDPKNIEAIMGLAAVELNKEPAKGLEAAIQLFERAIRTQPQLETPYLKLAAVYESAMALEKAILLLKAGTEVCQSSPAMHLALARLLIKRGRMEEANRELERTLELDPRNEDALLLSGLEGPHRGDRKN